MSQIVSGEPGLNPNLWHSVLYSELHLKIVGIFSVIFKLWRDSFKNQWTFLKSTKQNSGL